MKPMRAPDPARLTLPAQEDAGAPLTRFFLFDQPHQEPSSLVGFAGNEIEPRSEERDNEAVARALSEKTARVMLIRDGRLWLKRNEAGFDPYFSPEEARLWAAEMERAVLLGRDRRGPVLAAPAGLDREALPEHIKAIDHRSIYVQTLLDRPALGALAQAAALLSWHHNHRFCGRCGTETLSEAGGYRRTCPACGVSHFPRTDPVVIMLAVTRTHCLLGRSPHFVPGMYSCLAGFVEPGETIEQAVRRETYEESGVRIGRVAYHASQPWPFPYSLMIGCFGEALTEEIDHDAAELEDCRWFSRAEVRVILAGSDPARSVPPAGAIATHLIRAWADAD
jgi:NAD+ diphosphatase